MLRTQIHLASSEKEGLEALAKETGLHQSALIREAIDQFIKNKKFATKDKQQRLKATAGM